MNRTEYTYDAMDRMTSKSFVYDISGTDEERFVSKAFAYDLNGNLIWEMDGEGYAAGSGDTLAERIQSGYGTKYTYNLANRLIEVLDPVTQEQNLPFSLRNSYDGLGRKIAETNADGTITRYYYDDAGNVTSTTIQRSTADAERLISRASYNHQGNTLSTTDANGNTTTYEYNALGKVRSVSYPVDDTVPSYGLQYWYDVRGNVALVLDSMDKEELFTYDQLDRQLSHTVRHQDGSQGIVTYSRYDMNGNLCFAIDGNGHVTENQYDSLNRVKATINALNQATQFTYDKSGNLLTETDWRGNITTYAYDPLGRLVSLTDAAGVVVEKREYNRSHVQVKSYNIFADGDLGEDGFVLTTFAYDKNNRLLTTTDPLNGVTSQAYDSVGNISQKTDANDNTITYNYDHYNRLISVTSPNEETSSYTYDPAGNLLTQRDAAGNTLVFEYNVRNMVTKRIDPGGRTGNKGNYKYDFTRIESYTYNQNGTMNTRVDRNGKLTSYTYDVHGRLLSQVAGESSIRYAYDSNGNTLSITDSTGTTARAYDELGRVIVKSVPGIGVATFQYDLTAGLPTGHVKEVTQDVKGNTTAREYDKLGRLLKVTADSETVEYQYYQDGRRKAVIYPAATEVYTYFATGYLQSLENKTSGGVNIDSYTYTYDPAGNQLSKTEVKASQAQKVTAYEYDRLSRLSKVTEPSGKTTEYTFDKAGNRQEEKVVEGSTTTTTTYEYNSQNRLMAVAKQSGIVKDTTLYTYDHNGNMTYLAEETTKQATPGLNPTFGVIIIGQTESEMSRRVAHYTYDSFNQMVSARTGGTSVQYAYNGEGLRVQKTLDGETTLYVYENDKVVLELTPDGVQQARNVYGTNLLAREVILPLWS